MAKRRVQRPLDADDPSDVVRRVIAKWEFKNLLAEDPRVRAAWRAWNETLAARRYYGALLLAGNNVEALDRAEQRERSALAVVFGRAIPELVRAPAWVGQWLADLHVEMFRSVVTGETRRIEFRLQRPWEERAHRKPKNDGAKIVRDVRWFYRAKVKNPPESVSQLARQYADGKQRSSARSVIQDGLKRAAVLLELA